MCPQGDTVSVEVEWVLGTERKNRNGVRIRFRFQYRTRFGIMKWRRRRRIGGGW